jgi:UrcA family protein
METYSRIDRFRCVGGNPERSNMTRTNMLTGLAILSAAIALPAASAAQSPPEEIVVTGNYGRAPDSVRTLSQSVSYADLDLSTKAGLEEMRRRVNLTARFLCDKLGESGTGGPLAPSCRQAASNDAMKRVGTLESSFAPRGTTWVSPPAWSAPYPSDWNTRYP